MYDFWTPLKIWELSDLRAHMTPHQAIIWTNDDSSSNVFRRIHLRAVLINLIRDMPW